MASTETEQATSRHLMNLWTLGGLSLPELSKRTWAESWRDAVFGHAGRMAFYHFLGIFPVLFVFLTLTAHSASVADEINRALTAVGQQFLPAQVCSLFQKSIAELNGRRVAGWELLSAAAGALWASLNATWALIYGLNQAYEVKEERNWWKLAKTIVGLSLFFAGLFWIGFALFLASSWIPAILQRVVHYVIVIGLLMLSLAVVYRFAPNLRNRQWRWSTPGAVCAMLVWIVSSIGVRFYFEHVNDKAEVYGRMNVVVMLLLWLYLTNAAVLIGGEMNSEIEKASENDTDRRSGK